MVENLSAGAAPATGRVVAMNGATLVSEALRQINPDLVAAYPITPQTILMEAFSQMVADGAVDTELVTVESEHAALSVRSCFPILSPALSRDATRRRIACSTWSIRRPSDRTRIASITRCTGAINTRPWSGPCP